MGLSALELDVPLATNAAFRSLSPRGAPVDTFLNVILKTPGLSLSCPAHTYRRLAW